MRRFHIVALVGFSLSACAHSPTFDPQDPLEPVNRSVYSFNEYVDYFALRPVAKAYDKVVPNWGRQVINNFFTNLFYPTTIINDLLQFKLKDAGSDVLRMALNSTFGLGGLLDVAGPMGLVRHNEDFGQTLGYWGLGPGWYLMLPVLGPTTNRDLVGSVGDYGTSPLLYSGNEYLGWGLGVLDAVETRAGLLGTDKMLRQQLDRYVAIRTVYLEGRRNAIHDGRAPPEEIDFGDDDE